MVITSGSNERLKGLRRLYRDKRERDESGLYVAEGVTLVKDLDTSDIDALYVKESKSDLSIMTQNVPTFFIKDSVFDQIADTVNPSGLIAVLKKRPAEKTNLGQEVIVLCGVADAGNVGTILRTACARGIRTVICVETADPYSPKAVRASMTAVQKTNLIVCNYDEAFKMLTDYEKLALDAHGEDLYGYQKSDRMALFVGNEAHGIPDSVLNNCDRILSIPMQQDAVESLNAAVAASIAMYVIR